MRTSTSQADDVDRAVRGVVNGVRPRQRARGVRKLDDAPDVRRRPDRVGRDRKCDNTRPAAQRRFQVLVVESELVRQPDDADGHADVVRDLEPRSDVRVVVERRDDDLVALAQRACERPGQ